MYEMSKLVLLLFSVKVQEQLVWKYSNMRNNN